MMGEKDSIFKEYASDNRRFADLVNYFVYDGRPVIQPDQLRPGNIEQIICFSDDDETNNSSNVLTKTNAEESSNSAHGSGSKKSKFQQFLTRFRDLFKFAVYKQDDKTGYLFLGLEEQSDMCQFMPARMMLYDAMAYAAQAVGNLKKEFSEISEMPASQLVPVITLVVYFGHKKWTAPRTLYDMLPDLPDELKAVIPDFWINLIEPLNMNETDYKRMSTNWNTVFEAFKQYVDKGAKEYYNYLRSNPRMANVEKADIQIIETMTECRLPINKSKGDKNMNVNKMMEDYFKAHDEEVIEKAKLRIIEDATPKIIEDTTYNIAKRLLKIGVSVEDIQKATNLSDEQMKTLLQ